MKEEEPADGRKTEDEGIGKENLAILEKIKKNQRQDYLNVRVTQWAGGLGKQRDSRARVMEALASPPALNQKGCPQRKVQLYQFSRANGAEAEKSMNCLCSSGSAPRALVPHGAVLLQQDLGLPCSPGAVPPRSPEAVEVGCAFVPLG